MPENTEKSLVLGIFRHFFDKFTTKFVLSLIFYKS